MADRSTDDHSMEDVETTATGAVDKGKGKAAAAEPVEESDSSDESGPEEQADEVEPEDEDNMEEIDTSNIITSGRRTRGKEIDFSKAAADLPEDEDEDEDDDFKEADDDAMEE
ncbi:histone chaperone domain CHZ-domain-containing protein [Lophiotrema nucula]|uniref:Histone chaperone domain CHZ-domain-containing protein n=1 Tax=Lophiotrema nucula TaxID=690887 RepID=A0A6A5ZKB9_9PLEO|nr:histone chaperone domain CHZ-domain-containing protein [Lophiotrema nucula]